MLARHVRRWRWNLNIRVDYVNGTLEKIVAQGICFTYPR